MNRTSSIVRLGILMIGLAGPCATHAADDAVKRPNQLDFSMFFQADIRDSAECDVKVVDGVIAFGDTVSNPAATCPDAFAWKVFADITRQAWWENWSTNRQAFPSDPWPRCAPGETANCCSAVVESHDIWPEHCPVFPGDTAGAPSHVVAESSKAHKVDLAAAAHLDQNNNGVKDWDDVPAVLRNPVIGAVQNELVYRNEEMVGYIFDRELYSVDGLASIYANFVEAIGAYAPHWPTPVNPGAAHPAPPPSVQINLPIKSIMVKVNWLAVDKAEEHGIDPNDQTHPYIVMDLVPQADTNTPPSQIPVETKPFILLSMHISTRDLPNWFWATFEHVDNIGRCDWLGCNDSFGYSNVQTLTVDAPAGGLAPPSRNFTPPHDQTSVDGASVKAFVLAERYSNVDAIGDGLEAIFAAYGIGTGNGINQSGRPTAADAAWRSYRLKGTQTNFVTTTGRPTRLGNSVTESGFVNSASCISCHSRAGVTEDGLPPLAIFIDTLSDAGIPKSVNGVPNEAWFNSNAYYGVDGEREAPKITAIQTDFVWGFRNACPIKRSSTGPSWCANVTSGN